MASEDVQTREFSLEMVETPYNGHIRYADTGTGCVPLSTFWTTSVDCLRIYRIEAAFVWKNCCGPLGNCNHFELFNTWSMCDGWAASTLENTSKQILGFVQLRKHFILHIYIERSAKSFMVYSKDHIDQCLIFLCNDSLFPNPSHLQEAHYSCKFNENSTS